MPSYLVLRLVSFLLVFGFSIVMPGVAWLVMLPLAIAHYSLAIPYSKKFIANSLRRPYSAFALFALIAVSLLLSVPQIPGLIYLMFAFHFAFSDVYLMCENTMPNQWKETRSLRIASCLFNIFVYFASVREPVIFTRQQVDTFNYSVVAICACAIIFCLYRLRNVLTKDQIRKVVAFESLGLGFILLGMLHPLPVTGFISYHVAFWLFYPATKMIQHNKKKSLAIFAAANIGATALIVLFSPIGPFPAKMSLEALHEVFRIGALMHIFLSFGMSSAQPSFITRLFHPGFQHGAKSLAATKVVVTRAPEMAVTSPEKVPALR